MEVVLLDLEWVLSSMNINNIHGNSSGLCNHIQHGLVINFKHGVNVDLQCLIL
jgi:hypothetical protein